MHFKQRLSSQQKEALQNELEKTTSLAPEPASFSESSRRVWLSEKLGLKSSVRFLHMPMTTAVNISLWSITCTQIQAWVNPHQRGNRSHGKSCNKHLDTEVGRSTAPPCEDMHPWTHTAFTLHPAGSRRAVLTRSVCGRQAACQPGELCCSMTCSAQVGRASFRAAQGCVTELLLLSQEGTAAPSSDNGGLSFRLQVQLPQMIHPEWLSEQPWPSRQGLTGNDLVII